MTENKSHIPIQISRWSSRNPQDQFQVDNPTTGEPITIVQGGGADEIDAAVRAADKAFNDHWRWVSPHERGSLLRKAAAIISENAEEIARLESLENGKTLYVARQDVERCAGAFQYFGGLTGNIPGGLLDLGPVYVSVHLEPYGVIGGILPFNWPPVHTAAKLAPALAVGNTVVLKPGEQAPLAVMKIVELLQEVFPQDVIHAVPGHGAVTGQALVSHPLVRKVAFTGSSATGKAVLKLAAENITPSILELGGKNAFMIFADADLERAIPDALEGAFYNQGQACTAASRILVHRSIYNEVVSRLATGVKKIRVGDGADPTTHVGPIVTKQQQQRIVEYIEIGKQEGAVIAAQAQLPTDPRLKDGYFVPPTLFIDVRPEMRIAQEEIFGPVTCVIPFDEVKEAMEIANGTEYGLIAAVYTRSQELAMVLARQLDVGTVYINNYYRWGTGVPFGGNKASGFGRERSLETLHEFGRSKAVRYPSGIGELPQWKID